MPKKVLFTVLDWGLGHATRCVPLIQSLRAKGHEVALAAAGGAAVFFRNEFPDCTYHPLPAYNIRYPSGNMVWNMALQLPGILRTIRHEHAQVQRLVQEHGYQWIISDNRYGCWAEGLKNTLITHQIRPIVPALLRPGVYAALDRFYRRFDELWVPDHPGPGNLSGRLSEPGKLEGKVRFIGPLTRMKPMDLPADRDVIAVLSGPEPQRSRLEAELVSQARNSSLRWLIVQGRAGVEDSSTENGNLQIVPFMGTEELNRAICSSRFFVGRSGYSTLMDLAALNKPALLIPTPGQTEQLYLARRMEAAGLAFFQRQGRVDVGRAFSQRRMLKSWETKDEGCPESFRGRDERS
ncbi:MAG: glycosyltransferase [Saprospiraceae bacterium]